MAHLGALGHARYQDCHFYDLSGPITNIAESYSGRNATIHLMATPYSTINTTVNAEATLTTSRANQIRDLSIRRGEEGITPYNNLQITERAKDMMSDHDQQIDRATLFESPLEAAEYRRILSIHSQIHDHTIPSTTLQKKACVKLLFKAFKSTYDAADNQGVLKAFDEHRHDNRLVECLCWELLQNIILRCDSSTPLGNSYDPTKAKHNLGIITFEQRFNAVLEALAGSKSMCKHLFDIPFLYHVVDDPVRIFSRIDSNRKLNKQKGEAMKLGKSLIDAKKDEQSETSTYLHGRKRRHSSLEEDQENTPPTKRALTPDSARDATSPSYYTPDTPKTRYTRLRVVDYSD